MGIVQAPLVGDEVLKRVEADAAVSALRPVWRIAVGLADQVPIIDPLHIQNLHQALIDPHVLSPEARPRAKLLEVLDAVRATFAPSFYSILREYFDRSMQSELAVVEVDTLVDVMVEGYRYAETIDDADRIGICLHNPLVKQVALVLEHLIPHLEEDVGIERRPELTTHFALEVAVHNCRFEVALHYLHLLATVDRPLITGEDVCLVFVLP
mmetsp:Transcript_45138/g.84241  ORF Transcript_45138/g.84241 Transcript_45138/m.84241 type:complete len:211 (-) Transcript_45138:633-1265(-)